MVPLMIPAFFNSFKCCETVGCANGSSLTKSPQIHSFTFIRCSMMAIRAGWPNALAMVAIWFCCRLKCSVLVTPIYSIIYLLQYYDKINIKSKQTDENFIV